MATPNNQKKPVGNNSNSKPEAKAQEVKQPEVKTDDLIPQGKSVELKSSPIPTLGIFLKGDYVKVPVKATEQSSCFDIAAGFRPKQEIKQLGSDNIPVHTYATDHGFTLKPFARALVPTGLHFDIPEGYDVKLYARSGLSFINGISLTNSVGVIDADFRGEVHVSIVNNTDKPIVITNGMRIAQAELTKIEPVIIQEVAEYDFDKTIRSTGGFGSTGVN